MSAAEVVKMRTRHSSESPCPVCGITCYGSTDIAGGSTTCTTEAARGELPANAASVWTHDTSGSACECGRSHVNIEALPAPLHQQQDGFSALLRFSVGTNVMPPAGALHDHEPLEVAFEEFAARLANPKVGPKGSAGFYLPAVFEAGKRTKDAAREKPCLISVDLDFGNWSIDRIRETLPDGCAWAAYSTASHSPENPRFRVLLPLSEPLSTDRWILASRGVMRLFGYEDGNAEFDRCTEKIAQPMYLPTIASPESLFEFDADLESPAISAEMISLFIEDEQERERLAALERQTERARRKGNRPRETRAGESVIGAFNNAHAIERLLEKFGYSPPRVAGGRWLSPNSSAGIPAVKVWPTEGRFYSHHASDQGTEFESGDAFDLFRLYEHDGDWSKAIKAAAAELGLNQAQEAAPQPPPSPPGEGSPPRGKRLPSILVNTRQAREVVSDVVFAIADANHPPRLFTRIGHVVRVARNDFGVGEVRRVGAADQLNVLSESANFVRWDVRAKADSVTHPKREICAAAFARLEMEDHLPRLRAVTPTPIIHEDGTIVDVEGYDSMTGAYFAPTPSFKLAHVPDVPAPEEAQRGLETVMRPFSDLPFATDADRANFLLVLITVVVRPWFRTVPFIVFEAPIQGSGKTLVAMSIRVIAEGNAGIGAAPESGKAGDPEWRKRITAALLTGPSVVIFDNVTGTLGGPTLAALSTSPSFSDRLLGTNEAPDLPNSATWIFTSNNAQVDADLLRRCLFVRLDPHDAAPHLRDGFEIPDLIGHLEANRGDILAAIYTIVRFWIQQGKPPAPRGTPVLGSFEGWSRIVPAILGSVGVTGMLGDIEARNAVMRDPDEEDAAEFLESWWCGFPGLRENATAKELVAAANASPAPARPELPLPAAILSGKAGDAKSPVLARSLGKWLKWRRDRIVTASDGATYAIRLGGGSEKRGFRWSVERVSDGADS